MPSGSATRASVPPKASRSWQRQPAHPPRVCMLSAAARATERFAGIPLCLCCAVSGRPRRLLVRADVAAVQERHAERNFARLRRLEQALPDPEMAPAIEGLRCHPPRPKLRRNAAPLRPVLVPPDDRLERATQVVMRRLAAGTAGLDERLQRRPLCGR